MDLLPTTQHNALTVLRMLRPYAVRGFDKVRVGHAHDGGYVMVDDFSRIDAAYSLGVAGEVSWDLQIAERGIEIYQYDHTIDAPPVAHPRFHWVKTGIGAARSADESLDTLNNVMTANGHQAADNLILQCDIEGCEYDMLADIGPEVLSRFKQIVTEFHFFDRLADIDYAQRMIASFRNLTRNHKVVHVHANNFSGYTLNGGVAVPVTLEFTLVRAADYTLEAGQETFPTTLDSPNEAGKIDYQLGSFVY